MARSGDANIAQQVLDEMRQAKDEDDFRGNWSVYLPALAEIYARALQTAGKPLGLLNQFAVGLQDREISRIIGRIRT